MQLSKYQSSTEDKKWFKMDSRIGLDYIVENKDYTTKLAAGVCFFKLDFILHHKLIFLHHFQWYFW